MSWSKPIPTRAPTTSPPVPAPAEMTRATPQAFAGPPLARSASRDLNAAKSPVRRRPPTYHVPCTVKAQTHYPSHLRDIPATTGCQEGFDHDTWSVCSVIMTHFEKALEELSYALSPLNEFSSTRQLASAILEGRRCGLTEGDLNASLQMFQAAQRYALSGVQEQTLQAMIRTISVVDDGFDLFQMRKASYRETTSAFCRKCIEFDTQLREGTGVVQLCREQCTMRVADLERLVGGGGVELVGRYSVPERWGDILMCIVLYLRQQEEFC